MFEAVQIERVDGDVTDPSLKPHNETLMATGDSVLLIRMEKNQHLVQYMFEKQRLSLTVNLVGLSLAKDGQGQAMKFGSPPLPSSEFPPTTQPNSLHIYVFPTSTNF
jgi:hypothetical protein